MLSKTVFLQKFVDLVKKSKNIVITCHFAPDDDAIGSSLATYHWLKNKFPKKPVSVIITSSPTPRFSTFLGYDKIKFVEDLSNELTGVDLLIMQDGSQYSRFTRNLEEFSKHKFKKICIDHHSSPIDKFDLKYINPKATSASEIVMELLYSKTKIAPAVAEILLLGIFGDTGTFSFLKPDQLSTFDNVKKLMKISKIEIQEFKSRYQTISEPIFKIIQEYIKNTTFVDINNNPSYQYSFVTTSFAQKYGYGDGELSEARHIYMSQYLRLIQNYTWGFVANPVRDEISVSFRSLPKSVNVRLLVEKLEIGGGHNRASGSSFKPDKFGKKLDLDFAIKYLIDYISKNKLELG